MLRVAALAIAPVKGMRTVAADALEVAESGPVGDRVFHVREGDGEIALTMRNPRLVQVVPTWNGVDEELALAFPDGRRVAAPVVRGEAVSTPFYDGRPVPGRIVEGPFAAALSEHLRRPVQLVANEQGVVGGDDHPVTLMSDGSLAAVSEALDGADVDERRFRMTISIEGARAWEEDGWAGREVAIGTATLRVAVPTARCVVTMRDPDDGHGDLPILRALARLRGKRDVAFGVWCDVAVPGTVCVGDAVEPR
ncbi:MAG TPA: MOSC N-terminal beta barrel domain-containing protein [Solirubrobacteraceae bacterium]